MSDTDDSLVIVDDGCCVPTTSSTVTTSTTPEDISMIVNMSMNHTTSTSSDEPELIPEGDTTKKLVVPVEGTQPPSTATTTPTTATMTTGTSATTIKNITEQLHQSPPPSSSSSSLPHAIQIVSIGTNDDPNAFVFDSNAVQFIMSQIPTKYADHEIAIVSVVGAFRTGKSFLLSWFIHYLRYLHQQEETDEDERDVQKANVLNSTKPTNWYEEMDTIGNNGFHWRAGSDRNTTGIWMWSQPYVIANHSNDRKDNNNHSTKKIVLLIDTQGMFDHETTMTLTTHIFGLSTLLSSYQIYNVDKQIQEDNLQQLALFSEYARLMTTMDTTTNSTTATTTTTDADIKNHNNDDDDDEELIVVDGTDDDLKEEKVEATKTSDSATVDTNMTTGTSSTVESTKRAKEVLNTTTAKATNSSLNLSKNKPFQKIQFLVRDWQHFEDDGDDDDDATTSTIDYNAIADGMMKYLDKVLAIRDAKDLQDTREQILSCFDIISCFGLCHPGMAVTKKKFTGTIQDIEPMFIQLITKYCETTFHPTNLPSKTIHGRTITADQFGVYIQAYAKIFTASLSSSSAATGKVNFPAATTMLEATASANNTNAVRMAYSNYKNSMDRVAGPSASNYISFDEFMMEHTEHIDRSFRIFDSMANFGSTKSIKSAREQLVQDLSSSFETYKTMNDGRNPLAGVEIYFFPVLVAGVSYIIRWITDMTCSATVCRATSELLSHIYIVVFLLLCIIAMTKAQQIKALCTRVYTTVQVVMNADSSTNATPTAAQSSNKTKKE